MVEVRLRLRPYVWPSGVNEVSERPDAGDLLWCKACGRIRFSRYSEL